MKFAEGFADPLWVHPKQPGQCLSEIFAAHTIAPATHFLFAEYNPHPHWVNSPAAPTPAAPAAMSPSNPWLTTEELCAQLSISRSTLFAIKRSGLLKPGRHLVPKNPGCRRSHLLWHLHRCELALGRQP